VVEEHVGYENRWGDYIKMGSVFIDYEAVNWIELSKQTVH
jgi:hypothetical protein